MPTRTPTSGRCARSRGAATTRARRTRRRSRSSRSTGGCAGYSSPPSTARRPDPFPPMARLRFLALYALAWVPFVALYALAMSVGRRAMPVLDSLRAAVWGAVPAMVLGLGAWYAAGRLAGAPRRRATFVHAVLALVYSALWAGVIVAEIAAFAPRDALEAYLQYALGWQMLMGLAAYGAVAGARLTRDATRRAREREAAAVRAEA